MRKLFINEINGDTVVLTGDDHSHLSIILRAKLNDEVVLCCDGMDYYGHIIGFDKKSTTVKLDKKVVCTTEPEINVTLFFALLKGEKAELVVQKCTELGVKTFVPFLSKYVQTPNLKKERLCKIALEAAKQCGRGRVPDIKDPMSFDEMVKSLKSYDCAIFCYESEQNHSLKQLLNESNYKNIAVIVGAEGGFSKEEGEILMQNAHSVTLGKRILRAETACISGVSAVFYEYDWL